MICISLSHIASGQDGYQVFSKSGFKIKCPCTLKVNTLFLEMAKEQNQKVIGAFVCAENETSPEYGTISNVNIYDESENYLKISPSDYPSYEKSFLDQYANQLASNGMPYSYVTYKGVSAIEYSFNQMSMPTKAIMFLKEKKSYLIQVAARHNLASKFSLLKTTFELI